MDTKWKKSKKIISFLVFFLGVCLTLDGMIGILQNKPNGVSLLQPEKMLEDDYQQSSRFRAYISGRLDSFLIMATGGDGLGGIWGYDDGTYYGGGYNGDYYGDCYSEVLEEGTFTGSRTVFSGNIAQDTDTSFDLLQSYADGLRDLQNAYSEMLASLLDSEGLSSEELDFDFYEDRLRDYQDALDGFQDALDDYYDSSYRRSISPLTEEQKQKLAQKYHDSIKGDLNLLYSVMYDGNEIYSNSDLLKADGSMNAPDGYNFLLYFDGEKVRIVKDGRDVEVYGDGFYRDDSLWYVPGYHNFQTDESLKKVKICMAAAKEPVLYTESAYQKGGSRQLESALYWMRRNQEDRRSILFGKLVCLGSGSILLLLSLLFRKSRRQAAQALARIQAKIWVECKALLLIAGVYLLYLILTVPVVNAGYMWQEIAYLYEYDFVTAISDWSGPILKTIHPLFWICLFWGVYLLWNDLRHNKGFWRHSLIGRLCTAFSAKGLSCPLPRKMALRSVAAFIGALLFGLLALATVLVTFSSRQVQAGSLLLLPALIGFLAAEYLIGRKNTEAAKDMEALTLRIGEIRDGNYDKCDSGAQFSGHDLERAMEQLEDIRHGMASAVEEQMKSQRMKVELIANVSHDIKTPLTSIISYVEFLKQEQDLPEHIRDYVRILDQKSQRLKNMVQDVFAVSKAASGELPVHMEALDFGKLLLQTMADMQEQIDASPVTFRTELPETPVMITADGQRMYRVFQNLFQNAIQYSLGGSRVYVTLQVQGGLALASVKNTSCLEPEKDKDFTERFTRGDQSRTDGGSGLGLSIAQSFTEACGGKFALEIDKDRFMVSISFQILS